MEGVGIVSAPFKHGGKNKDTVSMVHSRFLVLQ